MIGSLQRVTRVLAGSLYGVPTLDPIAYLACAVALLAVALVAHPFRAPDGSASIR
jgi:hypothetical protein